MNKRIRVFLIAIAAVLVGSTLLFLTVNNSFISPYYIHKQKTALSEVCDELSLNTTSIKSYIEYAEENKGVVIATASNNGDINAINEQLRDSFINKGLGLSKYWLWEEDYENTVKNGTQQRVYEQGNIGYNILMQYLIKDDEIVAVATVIPHLSPMLNLANTFSAIIMGATALTLMVLVWWMSRSLEKAQNKVLLKNQQMKQLLNHVSHDLKTPIALIKAYTSGIKDGMDDGSFLDTIVEQNHRMEQLTLQLLDLSKYEDTTQTLYNMDISELLSKEIDRQKPLFAERNLLVVQNIQQKLWIQSNSTTLTTIFENLLSNAAKYATVSPIEVVLYEENTHIILEVKNMADLSEKTETSRFWEPFYVGESSRNSEMSGSGLGLSLVRAAAKSIGASCFCEVTKGKFSIQIKIKTGR